MNITNEELISLINLIGNKGLMFFALYIIYHYLGQIFTFLIALRIISYIVKIIDRWILGWFEIRREEMEIHHKK